MNKYYRDSPLKYPLVATAYVVLIWITLIVFKGYAFVENSVYSHPILWSIAWTFACISSYAHSKQKVKDLAGIKEAKKARNI